ncbi:MAG: hypothetical protein V4621_05440 [Pseudomonadota bacterium]
MVHAACYTQREAEAEQGIRIHSELMVIALNCRHMAPQPDLYAQYQRLTATNAAVFAGYEADLLAFYTRMGENSPEGELHSLRTHFANELATRAARVRPDLFCGRYAARIPRAASFTQDQMRAWASSLQTGYTLTHQVCKTSAKP